MLSEIAALITAVAALCNFALGVYIARKATRIHTSTETIVEQTNSLTTKLVEASNIVAKAEGVREGQAMVIVDPDLAAEKVAAKVVEALKIP